MAVNIAMAGRKTCVSSRDSTIGRWVLRYASELRKRIRRELRRPNRSWRVDEAGAWTYLCRAVDSTQMKCPMYLFTVCRRQKSM